MKKNSPLQKNDLLADILPMPLIFLDEDLNILSWNRAAQQLFNLQNPEKSQVTIQQLFDKVDFSKLVSASKPAIIETVSSRYPHIDFSLSLIDYTQKKYLLMIKDITQIHHLERMRQDFVANVSHELRTPLTVFHGYLEILLEQKKQPTTGHRKILDQMYQQSLRMEKLIDDLLLLARLENVTSENTHFKEVNVAQLLAMICKDAQAFSGLRKHQILLEADKTLTIPGLENELQSAFSNIIINAVNYTPAGGTILVKWYARGNLAQLEVNDTGIGIAPEHIPRLSERFYRIDKARSRSSGGTGLGLAIVKHVLLLHKAHLHIKSKVSQGSTFICQFPIGP